MFHTTHIRIIYYLVLSINGIIVTAFLLAGLVKKPSFLVISFFCFFILSVFHTAGIFLIEYIKLNTEFPVSLQEFWKFSRMVNWIRMMFVIFFIHSVYKYRIAPIANVIFSLLIAVEIMSSFFIYTLFPYVLGIVIVLYIFFYLLFVFFRLPVLKLSLSRKNLVIMLFIFSCIFLFGIILDILKTIPTLLVPLSVLLIDITPVYILCVGVVMAVFVIRSSFFPGHIDKKQDETSSFILDANHVVNHQITPREKEIIYFILQGETNRVIADKLFISVSTVKKHINNIFRKSGITSRWELLKLYSQGKNQQDSVKIHPE